MKRLLRVAVLLVLPLAAAAPAQHVRCLRSLPTAAEPGEAVGVALAINLPAGVAGAMSVSEQPPRGWEVRGVSGGGAWDGDRITWSVSPQASGGTVLTYTAVLPASAGGVGDFAGQVTLAGLSAGGSGPQADAVFTTQGAESVPVGASFNIAGFEFNTWEIIGILGTFIFAGRFIIQWIASERAGRSVIPTAFWWISILGSAILTLYGIHFRRIAVVLGQGSGFAVYIRNLFLIAKHRRQERERREAAAA